MVRVIKHETDYYVETELSEISGQSQKVSKSCHFLGTVPGNSLKQITIYRGVL